MRFYAGLAVLCVILACGCAESDMAPTPNMTNPDIFTDLINRTHYTAHGGVMQVQDAVSALTSVIESVDGGRDPATGT